MFILDTGVSGISISTSLVVRAGLATSGDAVIRLATANGTIQAPLAVLDEVDVGGAGTRHVPIVVHDLPRVPSNVTGPLGMSFLKRFRVKLDVSSGLLILETGN